MRNQNELQERFLKENATMRLGHLASDLGRIASLLGMRVGGETVKTVIEESKFFAEWAAPEVEPKVQELLADIQSFLALTELEWNGSSDRSEWRGVTARQLRYWSDELLKKAGFIDSR